MGVDSKRVEGDDGGGSGWQRVVVAVGGCVVECSG